MPTSLLDTINAPADLRRLSRTELGRLAAELRNFVLNTVSKTGGHLSSNLGTVELTVALHYVFNTPHDRIVWDVGHQTYPHKILTGRRERMGTLKQQGGISGFPRRAESEFDTFGTGHSSTSILAAWAMPSAAEIEVDEWPVPKVSNSLSARRGKPLMPPCCLSEPMRSRRPVRILCG